MRGVQASVNLIMPSSGERWYEPQREAGGVLTELDTGDADKMTNIARG